MGFAALAATTGTVMPAVGFPGMGRGVGVPRPRIIKDGKKARRKPTLKEKLAYERGLAEMKLELGAPQLEREERLIGEERDWRAEQTRLGREQAETLLGTRLGATAEEAGLGREAAETRLGMRLTAGEREEDIQAGLGRSRLEQAREFEMGREQRAAAGEEAAVERLRLGASLREEAAERAFKRKPTRQEQLLRIQQDAAARERGKWAGLTGGTQAREEIAPVISQEDAADFARLSPADKQEWLRRHPEQAGR